MQRTQNLTPDRISRMLARIRKPATASRACSRLHALSQRQAGWHEGQALDYLAQALNEHRHVLVAGFLGDARLVAEHTENRDREVRYALQHAAFATSRAA